MLCLSLMRTKMSNTEDDSEILDEIRALEDVLAKDEWSEASRLSTDVSICNPASRRINIPSRGFGEVTPQRESEVVANEIERTRTAYETNKMLVKLLHESKRELLAILEKCIDNKSIVAEKIRIAASNTKSARIFITSAGMPYFKDAKYFSAPRNRDAMAKAQNDELQVVQLHSTCPWTAKDRNILWRAIRQEASAAVLETERLGDGRSSSPAKNDDDRGSSVLNLPKNFKAMIGPLGAREFDWMKIAATDFENRHTPDECRVMWRVFLHPDINRYRWTKEEDARIDELSEVYKRQDWESLADELGSRRSGYQCFIRYNTKNRMKCFNERPWSEEEDARLQECMNKFKIGHYIPWGTVARYMDGRSKGQVYFRWTYNTAPHLKKGRFAHEEDSTLIDAVAKYGRNFGRISERVMPNRSGAQLSDRYRTLVHRERGVGNFWNLNDDAKLLKLYSKYGADWSRIAQELPGRTRTQARHRHKSILRYWDKGVSLFDLPRKYNVNDAGTAGDTDMIDRLERKSVQQGTGEQCSGMQRIDVELVKFFQLIPPALKPGRRQKYYREQELENITRSLYIILKTLDVNLAIPDDLDHRILTDKDKQLLTSLKDYQRLEPEYSRCPTSAVEYARMKMFGPGAAENDDEKHFTPLCSGNCNRKVKVRRDNSIEYRRTQELDKCQIKLDMEFDTPTIVSKLIGEEKNVEFNKLMRIFEPRQTESCRQSVIENMYVSQPKECSTTLSAVDTETLPRGSRSYESSQRAKSSAMKNKKERCASRVKPWDCSIFEGIIHQQDQTAGCVEPSYYTLLGLQHIVSKEKTASNAAVSLSDLPTSEEGARSLEILKKRLTQLFKYPIGLSYILRPEVYAGNFQTGTLLNNGTNVQGDSVDDFPNMSSSAVTKRRRFTDEREKPTRPINRRDGRSGDG